MTRKADPNSKKGINFKARSIEEEEINSNIKSYANSLNLDVSDIYFEMATIYLKMKGWPQHKAQTQLNVFHDGHIQTDKCSCGKNAVILAKDLRSDSEFKFCRACFSKVPLRYDAKVWKIIRRG